MRLEPGALRHPSRRRPVNFHNHGTDLFGFGKLQYLPSSIATSCISNGIGRARDSPCRTTRPAGRRSDDHQEDLNSFVNLGVAASDRRRGRPTARATGRLLRRAVRRHGRLTSTTPGRPTIRRSSSFRIPPRTTSRRIATSTPTGSRPTTRTVPSHAVELKVGTLSSVTRGHEDLHRRRRRTRATARPSDSDLNGHDVGVYAQTVLLPVGKVRGAHGSAIRLPHRAVRRHAAPGEPADSVNFFPTSRRPLYAYYGRLFLPTNVEDLRSITSAARGRRPRRRRFPSGMTSIEAGRDPSLPGPAITIKLSAYHKESLPGIDDNTVPGSAIVTSVNIEEVRVTRHRGGARGSPERPGLRLRQRRAQPRVRPRADHRRILSRPTSRTPAACSTSTTTSALSVAASATYSPSRCYPERHGDLRLGTHEWRRDDCNCTDRPGTVRLQQGDPRRPEHDRQRERRVLVHGGTAPAFGRSSTSTTCSTGNTC